jgi:hypothetical protein
MESRFILDASQEIFLQICSDVVQVEKGTTIYIVFREMNGGHIQLSGQETTHQLKQYIWIDDEVLAIVRRSVD